MFFSGFSHDCHHFPPRFPLRQVRQAEGLEKVVAGAERLVEKTTRALEIFRSKTGVNKAPAPATNVV